MKTFVNICQHKEDILCSIEELDFIEFVGGVTNGCKAFLKAHKCQQENKMRKISVYLLPAPFEEL